MKKLFALLSFISLINRLVEAAKPRKRVPGLILILLLSLQVMHAKYDPNRGLGKWTAENGCYWCIPWMPLWLQPVKKSSPSNVSSCHKLTEENLVGPGWKGVTSTQEA